MTAPYFRVSKPQPGSSEACQSTTSAVPGPCAGQGEEMRNRQITVAARNGSKLGLMAIMGWLEIQQIKGQLSPSLPASRISSFRFFHWLPAGESWLVELPLYAGRVMQISHHRRRPAEGNLCPAPTSGLTPRLAQRGFGLPC